jgi:hypothetical protein
MMRPSTVLWIALAGGVGVGVYQLKHRVAALEDDLFRLNRQIVQEQDAIHVLRAEWAYINQPQRLEALAQRHLSMQAMTPAQMGQVADLPRRPPPPATPVANPEPVLAALPAPPAAPQAAAPARPSPSPTTNSQTANSQTEGRAPAESRAGAPAARAPVAAPAPNSRPAPTPAPAAASREPSIADLLAAMRPPPSSGTGDPYAGSGRASPPAARMPAPRAFGSPDILQAGGQQPSGSAASGAR